MKNSAIGSKKRGRFVCPANPPKRDLQLVQVTAYKLAIVQNGTIWVRLQAGSYRNTGLCMHHYAAVRNAARIGD